MPYAPLASASARSEGPISTAWEFTGQENASIRLPALHRLGQPLRNSAWEPLRNNTCDMCSTFQGLVEPKFVTPEEYGERRRERAQYNIAILCALIKAVMSFRTLSARLRKLEEEELRAFKFVHIKTSLPQASSSTAGENADIPQPTQEQNATQSPHESSAASSTNGPDLDAPEREPPPRVAPQLASHMLSRKMARRRMTQQHSGNGWTKDEVEEYDRVQHLSSKGLGLRS
jgi:hypothetical protein